MLNFNLTQLQDRFIRTTEGRMPCASWSGDNLSYCWKHYVHERLVILKWLSSGLLCHVESLLYSNILEVRADFIFRVIELCKFKWMLKQLTEGSVYLGWWLKIAVCWDVTLCSLLKVCWRLEVSAAFTIMVDEHSTCENEFTVIVVTTDYILQISHSIWTRLQLCHWPGCLEQLDRSSVAVHSINMWHQICIQHTSMLANKFKICGPHSQKVTELNLQ